MALVKVNELSEDDLRSHESLAIRSPTHETHEARSTNHETRECR
jgi:hypothetical protein